MAVRPTFMNQFASTNVAINPGSSFALNGASQQLLAANPHRVAFYVTAPAAAVTLSLGGTAVAGAGITIQPNTTQKVDGYTGVVNIIGTNLQNAGVVEL